MLHEIKIVPEADDPPVVKVLRKLVLMARTSGGVAGRDKGLCAACDEAERVLSGLNSFTKG